MTGVFVLVGLAVAAICVGVFFFLRRRRRTQRLERDTAISAELAAAGFGRSSAPIDDDEDMPTLPDMEMGQRSGSRLTRSHHDDSSFDPYSDLPGSPTTPSLLPPLAFGGPSAYFDPFAGPSPDPSDRAPGPGPNSNSASTRTRHVSGTSHEPLLAGYIAHEARSSSAGGSYGRPPTPPPRNPLRATRSASPSPAKLAPAPVHIPLSASPAPPGYSSVPGSDHGDDDDHDNDHEHSELLAPGLLRNDSVGASTMRDERDYSRPMLAVRNMTDISSHSSA